MRVAACEHLGNAEGTINAATAVRQMPRRESGPQVSTSRVRASAHQNVLVHARVRVIVRVRLRSDQLVASSCISESCPLQHVSAHRATPPVFSPDFNPKVVGSIPTRGVSPFVGGRLSRRRLLGGRCYGLLRLCRDRLGLGLSEARTDKARVNKGAEGDRVDSFGSSAAGEACTALRTCRRVSRASRRACSSSWRRTTSIRHQG